MVTVTIGAESSTDSEISESWINEQISNRRRAHAMICVIVKIKERGLDLALRTAGCGGVAAGPGRAPNPRESQVFQLWEKLHLNAPEFTGGNLIAFLRQAEHV